MIITGDTLNSMLEHRDVFTRTFSEYAYSIMQQARLEPRLSIPRMIEARGAWKNDIDRVGTHEPKLPDGLNHFKHAAHLSFWLRRMSPLVEAIDTTDNIADSQGYPLTDDEKSFRELFYAYGSEYLAFDFGYQFVKFYENGRCPISETKKSQKDIDDYYYTVCHFMKYKTVSPHAMHLLYASLFM